MAISPSAPSGRPLLRPAWQEFRLTADIWLAASVALVVVLLAPLATVLLGLAAPASEAWRHVAGTLLPRYLIQTLMLLAATGLITLTVGSGAAWLVSVYDFRGRRFLEWALILPLALPTYIAAFAYAGLLDYTGPVQRLQRAWGLAEGVTLDILNLPGVAVVMSLVLYPYVYLISRVAFRAQSGTVVEAARMMGCRGWSLFRRVGLPAARPAVAGGLALVLMETLNDYGAVQYYGVDTFTTGIFRAWFGMGDADAAIRLAACLIVVTFAVLAAERLQRRRARYQESRSDSRLGRRQLKGWRGWTAGAAVSLPFLAGFAVPMGQLAYWTVRSGADLTPNLPTLVMRTFAVGAGAALLTLLAGLVILYTGRLHRGVFTGMISQASVLGYSIPGAVIAVGVLQTSVQLDAGLRGLIGSGLGLAVTGSLTGLMFAYVVRFLAVGHNTLHGGFEKIGTAMEEASRSLGRSKLQTLLKVDMPLLRGPMTAAALLVFVDVVKELPLTLILRPFNFDTLATRVFQLAGDERVAESAAGAIVIVLTSLIPIGVLNRLAEKRMP